jgi:hypothetical protein
MDNPIVYTPIHALELKSQEISKEALEIYPKFLLALISRLLVYLCSSTTGNQFMKCPHRPPPRHNG